MATVDANVQHAGQFLTQVRYRLQNHDSVEAKTFLAEIQKIQTSPKAAQTIIGIIGATGAGKSALINALLEEERVLPTSCMRACTAVVTEISHNDGDIPYRAEVHFVSKDEWCAELAILLGDLIGDDGRVSSECNNENTEAGLAYSKLKVVYPYLSKEDFARGSIEGLMSDQMTKMLDEVVVIEDFAPDDFYKRLQVYIDSGEKADFRLKSAKASSQILEYWPLIKVVRVFLKSPVLRNGSVLVDLPGVHDSNAARAAIAQNYLKECSRLFVVAPITRAVDDKSAKSLMGNSFKRQLKIDGTFGDITFICSKTDGINEQEAEQDLNLTQLLQPLKEQKIELEAAHIKRQAEHDFLKQKLQDANQELNQSDSEYEKYVPLLFRARRGKPVCLPISKIPNRKRRRSTGQGLSQKKLKTEDFPSFAFDGDDEEFSENEDSEGEELVCEESVQSQEITVEELEQKLADFRRRKLEARSEMAQIHRQIKTLKNEAKSGNREFIAVREKISKACILARNDYSRATIRRDFADGIKELDQELAAETNPETFDLAESMRNYDVVAGSLPVFCVSSLAFQRLEGRLKRERKARGFETRADTEIPQLQEHIQQVAETSRKAAQEKFLSEVDILSAALRIRAFTDDAGPALSTDEVALLENDLRIELANLTNALTHTSQEAVASIRNIIGQHISSKFKPAIERAQAKALSTVDLWGRPVDRDVRANSGIHPATYKATTRRQGLYPKKDITYDFNRDLSEPLVNYITPGWEKVFARLIPHIFKEAMSQSQAVVAAFQATISTSCVRRGASTVQLGMLKRQTDAHFNKLKLAFKAAKSDITQKHKDINREFVPTVRQAMCSTYTTCFAQKGPGMFARLKQAMEEGVNESKATMFEACTDHIGDQLTDMVLSVEETIQLSVQSVVSHIEQSYLQLVSNRKQHNIAIEKLLKQDLINLLDEYEGKLGKEGVAKVQSAIQVELDVETFSEEAVDEKISPIPDIAISKPAITEDVETRLELLLPAEPAIARGAVDQWIASMQLEDMPCSEN